MRTREQIERELYLLVSNSENPAERNTRIAVELLLDIREYLSEVEKLKE